MSVHYEWVGVGGCSINIVGKGFDVRTWSRADEDSSSADVTDGPSLIIGNDDSVIIMAKTHGQLTEFARKLLLAAEHAELNNRILHGEDEQ